MKRRDFIRSVAASAVVPAIGLQASAAASVPAIDTHTHFYDPTRPQGVPWPRPTEKFLYAPFLPDKFRAVATPLHVVGTVVVEASPWVEDNQWLLDLARTTPEIVGIVGNLKVGEPDFAGQLARFAANPLFRGLRVGAALLQDQDKANVSADLTRVAEAGLSLDVIGRGTIVAPLTKLARAWPTLRIVVNHLPFPEWDGKVPELRHALRDLARCPNVFAKISDVIRRVDDRVIEDAAHYRPVLDALCDLFGPERVVHGTNWPVSERVAPYASVHRVVADYFATKSRADAERYFWRNSLSAYRWIRRGAAAQLPS